MRKYVWLSVLLLSAGLLRAQTFKEYESKRFNWGAKVGFNSAFPLFGRFEVEGADVENINTEYKVGLLAAVFCRVNIERFFLQPSLEWTHARSDVYFSYPVPPDAPLSGNSAEEIQPSQHRRLKIESVGVPVLVGYNLIKEGPYGLSLMAGPKIKYNYKNSYIAYLDNSDVEFTNRSTPWNVGIVTGVGVSIWRLFFDFTYEFGINSVESDFYERHSSPPVSADVTIHKRTNMMSFSLGILF